MARPASTALAVMALLALPAASAPVTGRSFRPIALTAGGVSAAALIVGTWGVLPRAGSFASALLFRNNLNAVSVGVVVLVAVAVPALAGLHRSAQAVLVALGPAWVVLLIRSHTGDAIWLLVIGIAVLTVVLVAWAGHVGWRLRVETRV